LHCWWLIHEFICQLISRLM